MLLKIATSFLLSTAMFSYAGEKEFARFNPDAESIGQMSAVIREAARDGATVVRFPNGRWMWHDLTCLALPPLAEPKRKDFDGRAAGIKDQIRQWITEHMIKAVQVSIDEESPAKLFFMVESVLADAKVPYVVVAGAKVEQDRIILSETDGRVRSLPQKETKRRTGLGWTTRYPAASSRLNHHNKP